MAGVELFRPQPRLEIPENQPKVPQLDFTPLNQIGNTIVEGQRRQAITAAVARATGPNGQLDFERAGAELAKIPGALEEARPFLALAQQKAAREQSAGQHAATQDLARQRFEFEKSQADKPGYHFSESEYPGMPQTVYRTTRGGVENVTPTRPQPAIGSTEPIQPVVVPTQSIPGSGAQAQAPAPQQQQPQQQPAATIAPVEPQPTASKLNEQFLATLPPQIQGVVKDINERPELLKEQYKGDRRLENAVRMYNTGWTPPHPGFSPDTIETNAQRLEAGDFEWAKGIGRGGQQSARDITAVQNKMVENLLKKGYTYKEAAEYTTRRLQEFKAQQIGLSAGARTEGTREANLDMVIRAADAAIPAVLEQADKVWRSGFIPLNKMVQAGGTIVASNPEERAFGIANLQLAEHWARAMNPTGVMRESDRDYALKFLSTTDSPETYKRAVAQIQLQIKRERDAVAQGRPSVAGEMRQQIEDRISGKTKGAEESGTTALPKITNRDDANAAIGAAKAAIAKGADPKAVNERLRQMGVPPIAGP